MHIHRCNVNVLVLLKRCEIYFHFILVGNEMSFENLKRKKNKKQKNSVLVYAMHNNECYGVILS